MRKRRRVLVGAALLLAVAAGALYWTRHAILEAVATYLVVEDPLEKADAILLLRGGRGTREIGAAELFKKGYAPKVLFCRTRPSLYCRRGLEPDETDVVHQYLTLLGVPAESLDVLGPIVHSTYDEAVTLKHYFKARKGAKVIIVTSNYHTRRARWLFRRVFKGTGVTVLVHPTEDPDFVPGAWWKHDDGVLACALEFQKLFYYKLNAATAKRGY